MATVMQKLQALFPSVDSDGFNPDGYTTNSDKLSRVGRLFKRHPGICAHYLFSKVEGAENIRTLDMVILGEYCMVKADAMLHRLHGEIPQAIIEESECNMLYNRLPDCMRW